MLIHLINLNLEFLSQLLTKQDLSDKLISPHSRFFIDGIFAEWIFQSPKIAGVDLALKLLNQYNKVMFIGGDEQTKQKLKSLELVDKQAIYFNGYSDLKYAKTKFYEFQPDLVLVALGIPKQELFIEEIISTIDKEDIEQSNTIFLGVGGSFDIWTGVKYRAPKFFIDFSLEWLYRSIKEPFRLQRVIKSLILFFIKLFTAFSLSVQVLQKIKNQLITEERILSFY